jgi:cob(I)alamin adenosyltransferase
MADKQGLVQIYTGDGKGKTTAAIGQAIRAAGRGQRVVVIQFLKEGERGTGEDKGISRSMLPIVLKRFGEDMLGTVSDKRRARVAARVAEGFAYAETTLEKRRADMVVLDEVSHIVNLGLTSSEAVIDLIKSKPADIEIVMTGRDMPQALVDAADLVTEMKSVKHPYDAGVLARSCIEY